MISIGMSFKISLTLALGIDPILGGQKILTCRRKGRKVLSASLFGKQKTHWKLIRPSEKL